MFMGGWIRSFFRSASPILSLFVCPLAVSAQTAPDTLSSSSSVCCVRAIAVGAGVAVVGAYVALDQAWYDQYPRSSFHWFDDGAEWYLMDKAGHAFSAYTLGAWGHASVSHCGASPGTARWLGGTVGLAFLTGVEILDGSSEGWGFSGWDMVANLAGTGLFVGQDLAWGEQRFRLKFSAHFTEYAAIRPDLLGTSAAERVLKDYNGLTLWLSGNLRSASSADAFPPWLNLAVGYGAEGMISAIPGQGSDEVMIGRMPYRQFYLSPDLDLTRIPTKSRFVRTMLFVLNSIKVPAPALEIRSTGKVVGHWLYF